MSLQEKVQSLKLEAVTAGRVALFWENAIRIHGQDKAVAFYKSLGLNHLETKGVVEWEGMTLSREPTEAEKICVKGIAGAQETAKEKIGKILLELRTDLITDGLKGIKKLKPATYHELTLTASGESRTNLRDRLTKVYKQGRQLVAAELGSKKSHTHHWALNEPFKCYECGLIPDEMGVPAIKHIAESIRGLKAEGDEEFDDLDTLTDLTNARVANDVQSRITAAAARFALLGRTGAALMTAVQQEMADGSVSYIDRAATGLANRVISIGRGDEMRSRSDEIERYEYSALLDQNTCGPCLADDGKEAATMDELPDTPNPDCLGSDYCRCFKIAIAEGNM